MDIQNIFKKYEQEYKEATDHPFLQMIKLNEIKISQFNIWLQQDYLFVMEFTRLMGSVLHDSPIDCFNLIIDGLIAIKDEKKWFEEELLKRGLSFINIKIHQNCQEYIDFMKALSKSPFYMKIIAVYTIEDVYNKAWSLGTMKNIYDEIAKRWGNSNFSKYVGNLKMKANEFFSLVSENERDNIDKMIKEIFILEKKFWDMVFL